MPAQSYAHVDRCVQCRKAVGTELPPRPPANRAKRSLVAASCVAAIAIAVCAIAPLRATAFGFVEIFEPHQIALVPVTVEDLRGASGLPDFSDFGTSTELLHSQSIELRDVRSAQSAAGYRVRVPQTLAGRADVAYSVTTPALEQFTFSEERAKTSATANKRPWQPMPAGMDGSVLRIELGSIVAARYGTQAWERDERGPRANGMHVFIQRGRRTNGVASRASGRASDQLLVVQMPVPKVGSTGISMREIEQYMIDRPGVSPRLSAAFAALRDPTTTLPLPIPVDRRYARPVFVDGVWGTGVGDETGLGGALVWERDGFVYGVGGTGTMQSFVATANALR